MTLPQKSGPVLNSIFVQLRKQRTKALITVVHEQNRYHSPKPLPVIILQFLWELTSKVEG
jgi:hypothetical protein